jgi:hypothetical protein
MKLTIADCEIPQANLLYVVVSIGPFPVSFGAMLWGDEGRAIQRRLSLLSQQKALHYDAVDKDGLYSAGLCEIKDLKFEEMHTDPITIRVSGRLVHPFL